MPVLLTVALYVITSPAIGVLDARLASTPAQGSIDDSMCGVKLTQSTPWVREPGVHLQSCQKTKVRSVEVEENMPLSKFGDKTPTPAALQAVDRDALLVVSSNRASPGHRAGPESRDEGGSQRVYKARGLTKPL